MSTAYVDVNEANFEAEVLERSRSVPVLVDFWAPWCGPCRTLGPVLEELAAAAGGSWVLAKVNSDENPGLSQAFGIRGIPAVKAFVNGRVANEFTGALPKSAIQEFLRTVIPSTEEAIAQEAAAAQAAGDTARAAQLWTQLIERHPDDGNARLQRGRLRLAEGDLAGARTDLEAVPEDSALRPDAQTLLLITEWPQRVAARGGPEAVRERAAAAPEDAAARYDFGAALMTAGDAEGALAEFLEVVRLDRAFEDDAGRQAMLAVFALLGDAHAWTQSFRSRLARLLF